MAKGTSGWKLAAMLVIPFGLAAIVTAMILRPDGLMQQLRTVPLPAVLDTKPATAPESLSTRIDALGRGFDGKVGIAVLSVEDGWTTGFSEDRPFPQQSVRKLWTAAATLDAIDRGEFALDEAVVMTSADAAVFHQPIRQKLRGGAYRTNIAELLEYAMTQSDNAANDKLYRRAGGEQGVADFLARNRLAGIAIGPDEKTMQSKMAGLAWNDSYSQGRAFWTAREALPRSVRAEALDRYLASPDDGATPAAIAAALARLARGELLSRQSTDYLIALMERSKTGPERLRGGIAPGSGWRLAHKTGTGQVLGSLATAYNDIGLLRAPDGRRYAVAVMIGQTRAPVQDRKVLMNAVTAAVIDCDTSGDCRTR